MAWKADSIRSITFVYDDLANFVGRHPKSVFREENLVNAIRDAVRGKSELYFSDPADGSRHPLERGPEAGTFRFRSTEEEEG